MRAIQAASVASLQEYTEVDLAVPEPSPSQVRVRVAACGVGYVDALVALGRYQVKPPLPHVPGGEISGWIDAVGAGVTGFAVGDRVMAQVRGGFAEQAIADAASVNRLPDAMSAAGGVGLAAVQVGHLLGATVIAVASTAEKRALAARHGARIVLDREVEGWRERLKAAAGGGIDVVFDPVCGPLFQPAFRSLEWGGRHLVVGFVGGDIPALPANLPLMKGAALIGVDYRQFAAVFEADKASRELDELLGWVGAGRLDPPAGRVFPFEEYREALAFALSGQGVAKTVLAVDCAP